MLVDVRQLDVGLARVGYDELVNDVAADHVGDDVSQEVLHLHWGCSGGERLVVAGDVPDGGRIDVV